jgi:A/G-specific adenine glycosylase
MKKLRGKQSVSQVGKKIRAYYVQHGRHTLPWRKTTDPYAVLVSEIMLQQTQVDRVIPYFLRFIKRFPRVQSLARCDLKTVLTFWSGLGYNRRGKMLHDASKVILVKYKGTVPTSRHDLESLPGVGPYTAGAIRAFAFNMPDVFIETNIRALVLHHFFPRSKNVDDACVMPYVAALVHMQEPRMIYAALMDYGAYVKQSVSNPSRRSKQHIQQKPFQKAAASLVADGLIPKTT